MSHYNPEARRQFINSMLAELDHAYAKHGSDPWGRHEFAAVLMEEVDEAWDAVKKDEPTANLLKEAMQIACVCLRYAETSDRYRGPHPMPLPTRGDPSTPQWTLTEVELRDATGHTLPAKAEKGAGE